MNKLAQDIGNLVIVIASLGFAYFVTFKLHERLSAEYAQRATQPRWMGLVLLLVFVGALLLAFEIAYDLNGLY
jgi:uncharacterized membrane protein